MWLAERFRFAVRCPMVFVVPQGGLWRCSRSDLKHSWTLFNAADHLCTADHLCSASQFELLGVVGYMNG